MAKKSKQYVERNNIQFIGLKQLDQDDQKRIKDFLYSHVIELEREIKTIHMLRLHFKVYEKGGRKKYSVNLFLDSPTGPIEVNKMYTPAEWDPVACVHKVLDKAKEQIVKKFRTDENYPKNA